MRRAASALGVGPGRLLDSLGGMGSRESFDSFFGKCIEGSFKIPGGWGFRGLGV